VERAHVLRRKWSIQKDYVSVQTVLIRLVNYGRSDGDVLPNSSFLISAWVHVRCSGVCSDGCCPCHRPSRWVRKELPVLTTIFKESIWPSIEAAVDHLAGSRKEHLSELVKAGLNFSILLGAACYLEGALETLLRALLDYRCSVFSQVDIPDFETRRSMNIFYNRLEADLSSRIGRSIGNSGYSDMFELLMGSKLSELGEMHPLWEGVTVLFNFRNVLGHGREVSARHIVGVNVEGGKREEFSGSYRLVEDYLRKNGLLDRRFVQAHSEYVFLGDSIADHFWTIAKQVPDAVVRSLPQPERDSCTAVLRKIRAGAVESAQPN
jgi:hypothetical protein